MAEFRERAPQLARTAQRLAALNGAVEEVEILAVADARLIETGYDNYNGGTTFYTLTLEVPIERYAVAEPRRSDLEEAILKRMKDLTRTAAGEDITQVVISPKMEEIPAEALVEGAEPTAPAPAFWGAGYFRLFISHPSQAKAQAHGLKTELLRYQIACFVAHDDIEPTKEWEAEIESALRTMDALLAILTPNFLPSKWCDQEVGIAVGRGKLVIPLRAGSDPHGFLGKFQGINGIGQSNTQIARTIASALCRNSQSSQRFADSLIEQMSNVNTFENAKQTISILEEVPHLNQLQCARLLSCVDKNGQVSGAWGVPERIKALAGRVGKR